MNGIKIVFSKEMKRVFKDPKMIISLFILPVLLMVLIYGLIGFLTKQQVNEEEQHVFQIAIQNAPADLETSIKGFLEKSEVTWLSSSDSTEEFKAGIYSGDKDLLVVFPADFTEKIVSYKEGDIHPHVSIFFNPSQANSNNAWSGFTVMLSGVYEKALIAERVGDAGALTAFTVDDYDNPESIIMNEEKANAELLSTMLPYLITMLLFAGTMSLGTDSITGEKERGTMATMLVTPVNRSSIVLGKLLALTVLVIMSAAVYIISLSVALPKAMAGIGGDMSLVLGGEQIMMIAVIILSLAFLYVALVGVVSVYAKTVKEATTYVTPLYILVIVAGLFTMVSPSGERSVYEYLIPIYNSSIALGEVLTGDLTVMNFGMVFGSTLVIAGILSGIISKAFNSERVMFNA